MTRSKVMAARALRPGGPALAKRPSSNTSPLCGLSYQNEPTCGTAVVAVPFEYRLFRC